jgi:hypothetical protein
MCFLILSLYVQITTTCLFSWVHAGAEPARQVADVNLTKTSVSALKRAMITVIYADLQETIDVRGSSEQIDVVFVKKKPL